MTTAITFSDLFSSSPTPYEPATHESTWPTGLSILTLSATDWRPMARGALKSAQQECTVNAWDGPGSKPITEATIGDALVLIERLYRELPKTIPGPDILPEQDGEIDFHWYDLQGHSVSVSLSPRSTITYAANYGKKGVDHGWKQFDEAVETVVRLVVRLYKTEVGRGFS